MDETMQDLARRVRVERKRHSWTQDKLAREAGVSLGVISGFERFQTTPQSNNLRDILRVLDMEDEAGDEQAAETRDEWAPDIKAFLDMMGLFLEALPEGRRVQVIHDVTRQIMSRR